MKMKEDKTGLTYDGVKVKCQVFQDNFGARTISTVQKIKQRNEHIEHV